MRDDEWGTADKPGPPFLVLHFAFIVWALLTTGRWLLTTFFVLRLPLLSRFQPIAENL